MRLTPWARQALTEEEQDCLEQRATELDVTLGALKNSRHGWVVSASQGAHRISLRGHGPLAAVLEAILDDWQEQQAWTVEEILQVAAQSGIEVNRA